MSSFQELLRPNALPRENGLGFLEKTKMRIPQLGAVLMSSLLSLYGAPCCQAEIGVAERTVSSLILASIVDRLLRWDGRRFQGGALAYGDWRHWGRAAEQPCIRSVR